MHESTFEEAHHNEGSEDGKWTEVRDLGKALVYSN
jgi:hypothetical protein